MTDDNRLAVLIDADNTPARVVKDLFDELSGSYRITVKRAYGDWTNKHLSGWREVLLGNAISPQQQFTYTVGKNATDSALIIDAMDLLYADDVEGFAIVSSDSDFTPLATRLREAGKQVVGVGQKQTPKAFVEACERFVFLEVLGGSSTPEPAQEKEPAEAPRSPQSLLTRALNKVSTDDDGWASVASVGQHLNRLDPSFDSRTYDFARLSDLVRAQHYLETKTVTSAGGRNELWVRLKGRRPSATTEAPVKQAVKKTAKVTAKTTATTAKKAGKKVAKKQD